VSRSHPNLEIAAARHVLEILPSWELPAIADEALACGLFSTATAELAGVVGFQGLYGPDAIRALDEKVVGLAQEWLDKHGS